MHDDRFADMTDHLGITDAECFLPEFVYGVLYPVFYNPEIFALTMAFINDFGCFIRALNRAADRSGRFLHCPFCRQPFDDNDNYEYCDYNYAGYHVCHICGSSPFRHGYGIRTDG